MNKSLIIQILQLKLLFLLLASHSYYMLRAPSIVQHVNIARQEGGGFFTNNDQYIMLIMTN